MTKSHPFIQVRGPSPSSKYVSILVLSAYTRCRNACCYIGGVWDPLGRRVYLASNMQADLSCDLSTVSELKISMEKLHPIRLSYSKIEPIRPPYRYGGPLPFRWPNGIIFLYHTVPLATMAVTLTLQGKFLVDRE